MKKTIAAMRVFLGVVAAALWLPVSATTTDIYYHNDLAGTPLAATDANGNLLWRQGYKPYGERLDPKAPSEQQPWFTGKAHVAAAGLSYFGARWYDPQLGRFMGVDPRGFDEANVHSFNRYAYANNNPYRFVDPDGRVAETIFDVISFGISVEMFRREPTVGNFLGVAVDGLAVAVPFVPGGVGSIRALGRAADAVEKGDGAAKAASAEKSYQTYTKTNPVGGEVYCGRTSGCGTALENIAARDAGHHMSDKGFGPAVLDKSSSNSAAIRGREQQLIDANGGARSTGGTSGNAINAIAGRNPNRDRYLGEAVREFGH